MPRSNFSIFISAALSFFLMPAPAVATKLVLPLIDGWAESDGSGFAAELVHQVIHYAELSETRVTYLPYARAVHEFKVNKQDCLLGGDQDLVVKLTGIESIQSEAIIETKIVFYSSKEAKLAHSINDIKGRKVGYVLGGDVSAYGAEGIGATFIEIPNSVNGFKMLALGRIDYLMHFFPEKLALVKDSVFDPDLFLKQYSDRFQCHNSSSNSGFIEKVNNAMQKLRDNCVYDDIYQRYYGKPSE